MLIAVIVLLVVAFWGGMLLLYYKPEITMWLDNRWGPQHVTREQEERKLARKHKRLSRWLWYD